MNTNLERPTLVEWKSLANEPPTGANAVNTFWIARVDPGDRDRWIVSDWIVTWGRVLPEFANGFLVTENIVVHGKDERLRLIELIRADGWTHWTSVAKPSNVRLCAPLPAGWSWTRTGDIVASTDKQRRLLVHRSHADRSMDTVRSMGMDGCVPRWAIEAFTNEGLL